MSLPLSVYKRMPRRMPLSLGFDRYALYFDGEDDYVELPANDVLRVTSGDFTCEIMFKYLGRNGNYPSIIAIDYDWGVGGFALSAETYPDSPFAVCDGAAQLKLYMKTKVGVGEIHYYVIRKYGSTWEIWLDGKLDAKDELSSGKTGGSRFKICGEPEVPRYVKGIVYFVRLYNRALSESEICYNLLNYHNPVRDGLVLWLDFEEGHGDKVYDKSGYGNHGTIYGAKWIKVRQYELRAEVGL